MFLGCIGAIIYGRMPDVVQAVLPHTRIVQGILFGLLCCLMFAPVHINYAVYGILSGVLYVAIIINTFSSPIPLINFERPWLAYLGTISNGIYMYHPYVSYPLRYATIKFSLLQSLFTAVPFLYYLVLLALTILVAHLSYKYFETPFLRRKKRL